MRKTTIFAAVALLAGLLAAPAGAAGGSNTTPVAGDSTLVISDPGVGRLTPSGVIHEFGGLGVQDLTGDLEGTLYVHYRGESTITADYSVLVGRGSNTGELTWDGRTGPVTGMVIARCGWTGSWFTCSGTQTLHGAGDLDGVKFRLTWEGTFGISGVFTYTGVAIDPLG